MGPTNAALVNLFRADQALRLAQERLDAASKNVRVQELRVNGLSEKLKLAQTTLREAQSRAKQLELDLATRTAHIEKLRLQQQTTHNNKEYQAFTVEISTQKVDRAKVEEDSLKAMEAVEKAEAEAGAASALAEAERAKLAGMKAQSSEALAGHRADVEALRPARDRAAAALPGRAREAFERLAEHHEGEAMSALSKPDRRREEYLCTACNMELARDVYNKLHTRDEIVFCPSCRRILFIPDDLPPEAAIGTSKLAAKPVARKVRTATRPPRAAKATAGGGAAATEAGTAGGPGVPAGGAPDAADDVVIEQRAKGKLGQTLSKAQGETVRSASAAGEKPVECEVYVDGKLAGIYKGQTPQNLENAIRYYMGEAGLSGAVEVKPVPGHEAEPAAAAGPGQAEPGEAAPVEPTAPAGEAPAVPVPQPSEAIPSATPPEARPEAELVLAEAQASSSETPRHGAEVEEPAPAGQGPQG